MPRHPDPEVEPRILAAASRLWARGGEKALTMRAVASAAGTTTPTVYERYRDRDEILLALRLQTRKQLFAELSRTRTLRQAILRHFDFALRNAFAYVVLFDGVGKPPSLHESWPSFNLLRERVAQRLGGSPSGHNRQMLAIWSLMHGTAILIIRGRFEGSLRSQAIHACLDAVENMLQASASSRGKGFVHSGPKWPSSLILGEGEYSRAGNGGNGSRKHSKSKRR